MKILNFKDFMKKYKLKNDTMNESQLQKIYNYPIYPRDSRIYSDRGFLNIYNGSMGGTHWVAFIIKVISHSTSTRLEPIQTNFYLNSYLNQKYIIIIKYKILIQNFVAAIVYTFSI